MGKWLLRILKAWVAFGALLLMFIGVLLFPFTLLLGAVSFAAGWYILLYVVFSGSEGFRRGFAIGWRCGAGDREACEEFKKLFESARRRGA
ncbi:hypothetical protein [Pyrobaculum islandicum]|uniref:hypothetical protein n=1 Tax=Pyrobaculum islandicum TaxID=2277 RepID=UPI00069E64E3|nr:hypothetical protein [Pyrobaculum islandicum]